MKLASLAIKFLEKVPFWMLRIVLVVRGHIRDIATDHTRQKRRNGIAENRYTVSNTHIILCRRRIFRFFFYASNSLTISRGISIRTAISSGESPWF